MARNVALQQGKSIKHFTTAVFDLVPIQGDIHHELPKTDPGYYFRPHKTILVRTVADGGESYYFCGDHRATFPALRRALTGDRMTTKEILAAFPKLKALVIGDICAGPLVHLRSRNLRTLARNGHSAPGRGSNPGNAGRWWHGGQQSGQCRNGKGCGARRQRRRWVRV